MRDDIKIGISACLLGEKVRYDGELKLDLFLRYTLGRYVRFIPVCPEAECGFGVPREACYLTGDPEAPRLVTIETKRDLTDRLTDWSLVKSQRLRGENLRAFIFKSRSPSCGLGDVKFRTLGGEWRRLGTGIFATVFQRHFPAIPVIDENALKDRFIRRDFIEKIFPAKGEWETVKRELM